MGKDWIILRTAGRSTLSLARSLAEDGFEVWTPSKTEIVQVPRANVRRKVTLPLMPSFIFARSRHLVDLLQIASSERTRRGPRMREAAYPAFSVFHHLDGIGTCSDADLEPLRMSEARIVPGRRQRVYGKGERVRTPFGGFEGLAGVVEGTEGRFTLVCFGTGVRVKISTFKLKPVAVQGEEQPNLGIAA